MKKITLLMLALALVLGLCACGQKTPTWQEQYDLGIRYLSEGNYEEAIIAFTAAIEIDSTKADVYIGRGNAYMGLDQIDDNLTAAKSDYERAIALDKLNEIAYMKLADVYILQGKTDEALYILQCGLENATSSDGISGMISELSASGSVQYKIIRQDQSYYDEAGDILINLYYDQVQILGDNPALSMINEAIENDYNTVLPISEREKYTDFIQNPQLSTEHPFCNTTSAEVTYNQDGILSIAMTTEWYMGGVSARDYYGLNYNIYTGDELTLTDLAGADSQLLFDRLRSIVGTYFTTLPQGMLFDDAQEILRTYQISTLEFYINDDREIVLILPSYTFGPGATGTMIIQTGIFVNDLAAVSSISSNEDNKTAGSSALTDTTVNTTADTSAFLLDYLDMTVDEVWEHFGSDVAYLEYWTAGNAKGFYYEDLRVPLIFYFKDTGYAGIASGGEDITIVEYTLRDENDVVRIAPDIPNTITYDALRSSGFDGVFYTNSIDDNWLAERGETSLLYIDYTDVVGISFDWFNDVDPYSTPAQTVILSKKR